jgi:tetratricopeptide (TPR) repeat protein
MSFALACLAVLIGFAGAFAGRVEEAREHAERGVQLAQSGDLHQAEAELRRAVQLAPDDASYLTSLGGILGMEQKLAEANVYFEKAVKIDPANAPARRNLAANEWRLGQLKQAEANLEYLLRQQPDDKMATLLLGMVSENERDYARAAKLLAAVPDLVEQRPESVAALASAYYHTERRPEAHKLLEALSRQPASPQGILAAGGVAVRAQDYSVAEKLFESIRSSFTADRERGEVYNLLGMVEMKMDQFTDAVRSYSQAVELDPKSVDAQVGLASAKWAAGMRGEAEAQFQTLVKQYPRDASVYEGYGTSLLSSATDDAMLQHSEVLLRKAVELDTSRAEAHYQLGLLELKRDQGDSSTEGMRQALAQLQTAVQLGLNESRVHYALARVYRRLGREGEATKEMNIYQHELGGAQSN